MIREKKSKTKFGKAIFGFFLMVFGVLGLVSNLFIPVESAYADPVDNTNTTETTNVENTEVTETTNESNSTDNEESESETTTDGCKESLGAIGWLVCPTTGAISKAVDFLYGLIQEFLQINPVVAEDGQPIYEIWKYCRGITNIVFIILLLVVIYSQLTGLGISNYGIKKTLPKLIIVAVLVNLSFLICSLAVDVSNIIGNSLRGLFDSVQESALVNMSAGSAEEVSVANSEMFGALAGGTALTIGGAVIAFETGAIWMMIPVILGALVAVVTGLITIALRQAVVTLLIMISPLAIVAYMLPNTENLFQKWKKLLTQMLVFYPMFSLLFGASALAGFAIIASATSGFGLLLGVAVQIFPLFFSWKLMQMSGTFLGTINSKMRDIGMRPVGGARTWADSHRMNKKANTMAKGVTPSASLMQYLNYRKALREEDTKNALGVAASKATAYTQKKIAGNEVLEATSDTNGRRRRASRYTRNAKRAINYSKLAQDAMLHTEHVLGSKYEKYYNEDERDRELHHQYIEATHDYNLLSMQREMDEEDDIDKFVETFYTANRRDENNRPVDEVAYNRYMRAVAGTNGEGRLLAKVVTQASKVNSKRRAEYERLWDRYKLNGYNKNAFRSFVAGYMIDGDGWAIDLNGDRLKYEDGTLVESVQGEAITKAPEKLVLYDKRDEHGIYFDMKDQDGNIVARIHRGTGADGLNYDDPAFIKETLSNFDIPIGDPSNMVYSILAGVKNGSIVTPQGQNDIGLADYSTTIGKAMNAYKGDAAWSGAMFNSGIANRQIKNSAQYAIWALDSIKKTVKPGPFNVQSPSSIAYLQTILDPDNWDKIFTEEAIMEAININNEPIGGEEWEFDENGKRVGHHSVENPTYEQRMNTIKRKYLEPALKKIIPAFDRLRTSNTIDNQKPGTADAQYELLKMIEEKWENNENLQFDPTLVDQDLPTAAREFRGRKHDEDGNLLYADRNNEPHQTRGNGVGSILNLLDDVYDRAMTVEDLKTKIFEVLNRRDEYERALERFDELCNENPDATMEDIRDWFDDLDTLIRR